MLWLDRIQADEANILVAIDRSFDGGDPETASAALREALSVRGAELSVGDVRALQSVVSSSVEEPRALGRPPAPLTSDELIAPPAQWPNDDGLDNPSRGDGSGQLRQ